MARKTYKPEEIIGHLRTIELEIRAVLFACATTALLRPRCFFYHEPAKPTQPSQA